MYQKARERLRVIEKSTDQSISNINDRLRDFKEDIKRKSKIKTDLEELESNLILLQKELVEVEPKLEKYSEKFELMNSEREEINQLEERLRTQKEEIEKREQEITQTVQSLEIILKRSISKDIQELTGQPIHLNFSSAGPITAYSTCLPSTSPVRRIPGHSDSPRWRRALSWAL